MYTILCMLCASSKSAKSDDIKMTEPTQVPYELYCNYVQLSSTIADVSLQAYIYIHIINLQHMHLSMCNCNGKY